MDKLITKIKSLGPTQLSLALVISMWIIKEILLFTGIMGIIMDLFTSAFYLLPPLLSITFFMPVWFLVIDVPFFFVPTRYVLKIREKTYIDYIKFYTLYFFSALIVASLASGSLNLVTQFIFLKKVLEDKKINYLDAENKNYKWHILLFLILIALTIFRFSYMY